MTVPAACLGPPRATAMGHLRNRSISTTKKGGSSASSKEAATEPASNTTSRAAKLRSAVSPKNLMNRGRRSRSVLVRFFADVEGFGSDSTGNASSIKTTYNDHDQPTETQAYDTDG